MTNALLVAIGAVAALLLAFGRRYLSIKHKKRKLMEKIREVEYEMCSYDVGTTTYNDLDIKLRRLNQTYADLCRNS